MRFVLRDFELMFLNYRGVVRCKYFGFSIFGFDSKGWMCWLPLFPGFPSGKIRFRHCRNSYISECAGRGTWWERCFGLWGLL